MKEKRGIIGINITSLMPKAIEMVSEGALTFTMRQLFYKIREIYLKQFPEDPFYKGNAYRTFTQDFLPKYEKKNGKIRNMIRSPSGKYCARDTHGISETEVDTTTVGSFSKGVSDKILVIEKSGQYRAFIENKIPEKFDINVMHTQGFSSDACKTILKKLEDDGFKIYVLHDYDVNGVLIKETLTRKTRRRDIHLDYVEDLGFSWKEVKQFILEGMSAEPVSLKKEDISKLDGLLTSGIITKDAYNFLRYNRFELDSLTPIQIVKWLKKRFEELGICKVVPSEKELNNQVREYFKSDIDYDITQEFGLSRLGDLIDSIKSEVEDFVYKDDNNDLFDVETSVEDFKEVINENKTSFWKGVLYKYTWDVISEGMKTETIEELIERGLKENLKGYISEIKEQIEKIEEILG